jgi:hypothetical protein
MSRSTVQDAVSEIDLGAEVIERIRQPGAGRKKLIDLNPGLLLALDDQVEPTARGDPMSPLRWTPKSVRTLAAELVSQGHHVSASKVGQLLKEMGYSLQAPAKEVEGPQHRDRDAQFHQIKEPPCQSSPPVSPRRLRPTLRRSLSSEPSLARPSRVPRRSAPLRLSRP